MNARITAAVFAAIAANHLVAQGPAKLQSYQFDLIGGWARSETDKSPDIEIDRFLLAGTYHLKPVALADHPWNEAAFLEHSTAITALVDYTDFGFGSFSADGVLFGVGFRYAEKETPIAAELSFQLGSLDGDSGADIDLTEVNARIGYWLSPNAIIGADARLEQVEANGPLDVEELRFGAFGKIVQDLGEGSAINAEARFGVATVDDSSSEEDNIEFTVSGDFYFTPRHSIGALVQMSFGDAASLEGTTVGLRGSAWLTPQVAVGVSFSRFMAEDNNRADEDTFSVLVNVRF